MVRSFSYGAHNFFAKQNTEPEAVQADEPKKKGSDSDESDEDDEKDKDKGLSNKKKKVRYLCIISLMNTAFPMLNET